MESGFHKHLHVGLVQQRSCYGGGVAGSKIPKDILPYFLLSFTGKLAECQAKRNGVKATDGYEGYEDPKQLIGSEQLMGKRKKEAKDAF